MPRQKKPIYTWLPDKKLYRKKIKDTDGEYVCLYGHTPDELTEKIEAALSSIAQQRFASTHPTFSQYAFRWIELNCSNISHATRTNYESLLKNHMIPCLGHKYLQDITSDDVKAAMLHLQNKSASAYNKVLALYRRIFDSAVDANLIACSPCTKLKRGGIAPKEKHALTDHQVEILCSAVAGTPAEVFVLIALYSGMRREEILALQWDCVHLSDAAPYIEVKRALRWENNQPIVDSELKSATSRRNIPIPPQLVSFLTKRKNSEQKLPHPSDYVIHNTSGGPKTQTQFKNLWHSIECRTAGTRTYTLYRNGEKETRTITSYLGDQAPHRSYRYTIDFHVTPHILRHTYITHLILSGADVKTVQYLAGHATPDITLAIYSHLTYNRPEDLIDKVKNAFS